MKRLRQDLIHKSKVIKSSFPKINSLSRKSYKIVNFSPRGGSEEVFYTNAERVKRIWLYLATLVHNKNNIINLMLFGPRVYLRLILILFRINLPCYVDPITGQSIVITIVSGGTTGFIISWLGVGTILFANFLGIVFLSRSLTQQMIHNLKYPKVTNQVVELLKSEKIQPTPVSIAERIELAKVKIKMLNWEKKRELKEAAERLGIFEEKPILGPIKSNESYLYKRYLEKLGKAVEKVMDTEAESRDVDFVDIEQSLNSASTKIRN